MYDIVAKATIRLTILEAIVLGVMPYHSLDFLFEQMKVQVKTIRVNFTQISYLNFACTLVPLSSNRNTPLATCSCLHLF